MNLTPEQEHILSLANDKANLLVNALAGTGKTSTLELFDRATRTKPALYLVFNKKNAEEATKRMQSTTTVRTFNSLGHRIWAQAQGNLSLNPQKCPDILRAIIEELPRSSRSPVWEVFWDVIAGVALAKALGYIPEGKYPNARRLCTAQEFHRALDETPDDLTSDLIDAVLTRSIAAAYARSIDYNDQIYMPALFGGTYPQFPLVLVDEAQDLSPVNHAMLDKLCKHRVIAVGDPWQNIYGFRGALSGGMSSLKARFNMTECDLSVSFRCPQAVVENARWRVPHFKWVKPGGRIERLDRLELSRGVPDEAVFICRNNAPLFRLAFNLLSCGRSVSVAGSDIGPKLLGILRKLGPENLSRSAVLSAIDEWQAAREDKQSATAGDMADCMRVFANHADTLGSAVAYAEHLFAQKGSIRLLTGHKSKGLEFPRVYHLDPHLCRETEQDKNLRYVINTRSSDTYLEINTADIV